MSECLVDNCSASRKLKLSPGLRPSNHSRNRAGGLCGEMGGFAVVSNRRYVMRKISIELHPLSAICGAAAVALVLSFVSAAQVGPATGYSGRLSQALGSTPVPVPGIKAEDMIWINSGSLPGATPNSGRVTINPLDEILLLQIPVDKYFVMVDVHMRTDWNGGLVNLEEVDATGTNIKMVRDEMGDNYSRIAAAPLGISFKPGSQMLLRNIDGINAASGTFGILGYFVDA
jgi:hypothetical protein